MIRIYTKGGDDVFFYKCREKTPEDEYVCDICERSLTPEYGFIISSLEENGLGEYPKLCCYCYTINEAIKENGKVYIETNYMENKINKRDTNYLNIFNKYGRVLYRYEIPLDRNIDRYKVIRSLEELRSAIKEYVYV